MTTGPDPRQASGWTHAATFGKGAAFAALALVATGLSSGCTGFMGKSGWSNKSLLQVQFHAPPGAVVGVRPQRGGVLTKQINGRNQEHRLENPPAMFAAFNLAPGRNYDFQYTQAEGLPGAHVYGELEVYAPKSEDARRFMAHSFIPVDLISRHGDSRSEHYYPAKGSSGTGLGELEAEHLAQGDMLDRVYFIADLQKAWETIRQIDFHVEKLRSAEAVLNAELELLDNRYESYRRDSLYVDPTSDSLARSKDSSGANLEYVRIEADRQRMDNQRFLIRRQVDDLTQERRIRKRLLDTMKIVTRRGSLVLATPENQWPYHDTGQQIAGARSYTGHMTGPTEAYTTGDIEIPALGELICVVRIGGRHMHWDTGDVEQVAMNP